jgi:hypothetical protein
MATKTTGAEFKAFYADSPLACPFCGKAVDLDDHDTLYPSGTGWMLNEELQMRTYHSYNAVPPEQWCYTMHCPVQAGGCGAEMHGDTRADALGKWNMRANAIAQGREHSERPAGAEG